MRERVIHRGLLSGEASNGDILGEATKSVSKTLYEATRTLMGDQHFNHYEEAEDSEVIGQRHESESLK
jgi:hypothetical protein